MIVGLLCGMSVLRGAHVFAQGIVGAPSRTLQFSTLFIPTIKALQGHVQSDNQMSQPNAKYSLTLAIMAPCRN